jgi:hypothetical protein
LSNEINVFSIALSMREREREGGVSGFQTIVASMFGEGNFPCTLKTSFVDFERE